MKNNDSWRDMANWISLRHSPHTPRFKGCGLPNSFRNFDWIIWSELDARIDKIEDPEPSRILCVAHPVCIKTLLEKAQFNSKPSLLLAGMDTNLSIVIEDINKMSDRFSAIYYEAKDIESDIVKSFSMGFISYYLRDAVPNNIFQAIRYSNENEKVKDVLAAWGRRWKMLDETIEDRRLADVHLNTQTHVSRSSIPFEDYWQELAKYRFLIAPRGQGVQSSKLAEAWMVKTIPIVTKTPCFTDLQNMGYPLIIIDSWEEVTPDAIQQWRLEYDQVSWSKVRYMLTNSFLDSLLSNSG